MKNITFGAVKTILRKKCCACQSHNEKSAQPSASGIKINQVNHFFVSVPRKIGIHALNMNIEHIIPYEKRIS